MKINKREIKTLRVVLGTAAPSCTDSCTHHLPSEGCSLMLICWPTLPTSNFSGSQDQRLEKPFKISFNSQPNIRTMFTIKLCLRCQFQRWWLPHCPWWPYSPFQPCEKIFLVSNQNLPWHNWRPFLVIQSLVTCSLEPVTCHFLN